MNSTLERHFAAIGARLKSEEPRPRPRLTQPWGRSMAARAARAFPPSPVRLDVRQDAKGEFFLISAPSQAEINVVNLDAPDRHLLLSVVEKSQTGRYTKSKFLAGHDERHWFVAAIPESASGVTTVAKAKAALQPAPVRAAAQRLRPKQRLRRRTGEYKRQGEWFFVPAAIAPPANLILRDEPLTRGRGKPHRAEFCYRSGGEDVWVGAGQTLLPENFERLDARARRGFTLMRRNASVYVKGRISHSDHASLVLEDWHVVLMNTEQGARAMANVAFLD